MFYPICIICVLLVLGNLSVPSDCEDLLQPLHQVISANLIGLSGKSLLHPFAVAISLQMDDVSASGANNKQ